MFRHYAFNGWDKKFSTIKPLTYHDLTSITLQHFCPVPMHIHVVMCSNNFSSRNEDIVFIKHVLAVIITSEERKACCTHTYVCNNVCVLWNPLFSFQKEQYSRSCDLTLHAAYGHPATQLSTIPVANSPIHTSVCTYVRTYIRTCSSKKLCCTSATLICETVPYIHEALYPELWHSSGDHKFHTLSTAATFLLEQQKCLQVWHTSGEMWVSWVWKEFLVAHFGFSSTPTQYVLYMYLWV